jgi:cytochrome c-type biogenesis protein CcmH/NrfG
MKNLTTTIAVLTALCAAAPAFAAETTKQDQDDIQATIVRFKAAVDVNPKNSSTRTRLGMAYLMNNDLDNAMAQLKKAAELDSKNTEAFVGM